MSLCLPASGNCRLQWEPLNPSSHPACFRAGPTKRGSSQSSPPAWPEASGTPTAAHLRSGSSCNCIKKHKFTLALDVIKSIYALHLLLLLCSVFASFFYFCMLQDSAAESWPLACWSDMLSGRPLPRLQSTIISDFFAVLFAQLLLRQKNANFCSYNNTVYAIFT